MTQAAFELQRTETKVVDIALKYGYTSPTSFNRAFQKVHGISPKQAKIKGCSLNVYPVLRFSVTVMGGESMTYRMLKAEGKTIFLTSHRFQDIEQLCDQIYTLEDCRLIPITDAIAARYRETTNFAPYTP